MAARNIVKKLIMSGKTVQNRIDSGEALTYAVMLLAWNSCRITNSTMFRAAMQLPLNRTVYAAERNWELRLNCSFHQVSDR
jgi:hypothetical protein